MTLRRLFSDNRRSSPGPRRTRLRLQAALVALLYVFLCAFGVLTHDHATGDIHARAEAAATTAYLSVSSSTLGSPTGRPILRKAGKISAAHCAFCDWQANSNALPQAPFRLIAPLVLACAYASRPTPTAPVRSTRPASRAPPAA